MQLLDRVMHKSACISQSWYDLCPAILATAWARQAEGAAGNTHGVHCRHIFEHQVGQMQSQAHIKWALPGKERQDSVFNGFSESDQSLQLVAVHDSARPLIAADDFR